VHNLCTGLRGPDKNNTIESLLLPIVVLLARDSFANQYLTRSTAAEGSGGGGSLVGTLQRLSAKGSVQAQVALKDVMQMPAKLPLNGPLTPATAGNPDAFEEFLHTLNNAERNAQQQRPEGGAEAAWLEMPKLDEIVRAKGGGSNTRATVCVQKQGWKFPHTRLTVGDTQSILEFYVLLSNREEASQIVELCRVFSQTLLQDFPTEVFLQTPSIVTRFLQLMQSPISFNRTGGRHRSFRGGKEWEKAEHKHVFDSIIAALHEVGQGVLSSFRLHMNMNHTPAPAEWASGQSSEEGASFLHYPPPLPSSSSRAAQRSAARDAMGGGLSVSGFAHAVFVETAVHLKNMSTVLPVLGLLRSFFPFLLEPFLDHPSAAGDIDLHSLNCVRVTQYLECLAAAVAHHSDLLGVGGLQKGSTSDRDHRDRVCLSQLKVFALDLVGLVPPHFLSTSKEPAKPVSPSLLEAVELEGDARAFRKVVVPSTLVDAIEGMAVDSQLQACRASVLQSAVEALRILRPASCDDFQHGIEIGLLLDDMTLRWEELDGLCRYQADASQQQTASTLQDTVRVNALLAKAGEVVDLGAKLVGFLPLLRAHDAKLQAYKILASIHIRVFCETWLAGVEDPSSSKPTTEPESRRDNDATDLHALLLRLQFSSVACARVLFYDFVGFLLTSSHDIWEEEPPSEKKEENVSGDATPTPLTTKTTSHLVDCFQSWIRAPDTWAHNTVHGQGATFEFSVSPRTQEGDDDPFPRLPRALRRGAMACVVWDNAELLHRTVTCAIRDPHVPVLPPRPLIPGSSHLTQQSLFLSFLSLSLPPPPAHPPARRYFSSSTHTWLVTHPIHQIPPPPSPLFAHHT
jgi:hypothetical protein